ncbi:MAG: AAA family ATPase, partial [Bacillota bacterium]|nr:AAA family ATPase [Bacillota bacterium]
MDKIKVLAVADSEDGRYILKRKLTSENLAVTGFSKAESALEKALSARPGAVVILPEKNEDAVRLALDIYISLPGCAVFLLSDNIDMSLLEASMGAGVRKILKKSCGENELLECIRAGVCAEKARARNFSGELSSAKSKVLSVFGAKGGIGKTTIASNLAVTFAQSGSKTIIIDLDLQFGDVNLFFDLEPRDTIAELVQDKQNFDIDTMRGFIKIHSSGVSVLCAPKSPEFSEMIKGEHIEKIINTLRPYYDYIIIDTPPVFNDTTIVAIENSDKLLLIVSPDISSLRNAKISMDVLDSLEQKEK